MPLCAEFLDYLDGTLDIVCDRASKFYFVDQVDDLLDYLEEEPTWWVKRDLPHNYILNLACTSFNEYHPDDDPWVNNPLNKTVGLAHGYALSCIRHCHSRYEESLQLLKDDILGVRHVPETVLDPIRDAFIFRCNLAYPNLREYLDRKYKIDNGYGDFDEDYD